MYRSQANLEPTVSSWSRVYEGVPDSDRDDAEGWDQLRRKQATPRDKVPSSIGGIVDLAPRLPGSDREP